MGAPLLALLLLVAALPLRAEEGVHVVQPKQTLSAIARIYGIPMASLISLNGIEDPNKVKIGTPLKLPAGLKAVAATAITTTTSTTNSTPVATATIPTKTTKPAAPLLLAKKSTNPDWRYYGPLQVDWSNWRTMAGSLVAPSINKEGQPLYVAVNCGAKKLNVTGPAGAWKAWEIPSQEFEKDLVASVCRDKSLQRG
jgi:murein DD-endopeptidase MepM/ murein hydrolase activator NlpD